MKILSYSLFYFIFCFMGICERSIECEENIIPSFNCDVNVSVIDTENGINCGPYGVEFESLFKEAVDISLVDNGDGINRPWKDIKQNF